jgi:uncharacterized protein DUF732
MKKVIAAAGLGAALIAGLLAGAGTASATPAGYLAAVSEQSDGVSQSTRLELGYATCDVLTAGRTKKLAQSATLAMVGKVFLDNGFSPKSAATVVFASITELCPSNYSYTTAGADDLAGDGGELYA